MVAVLCIEVISSTLYEHLPHNESDFIWKFVDDGKGAGGERGLLVTSRLLPW